MNLFAHFAVPRPPGLRSESGTAKTYAAVAGFTIITLVGLESYALNQGINGSALTASLAAIAGIGGTGIGRLLK